MRAPDYGSRFQACNELYKFFCALQALERTLTVEDAIESVFQLSSESEFGDDDDDEGNALAHVDSQHMHHMSDDYDIPMGASQSANPASISIDIKHQGTVPAQKRPPKAAHMPALHTQPASFHQGLTSQAPALSHSQQLSMSRQHSGSGSGSLGSGVGRRGSVAGAAGPSRLGAAGQGRASGCSQQVLPCMTRTACCSDLGPQLHMSCNKQLCCFIGTKQYA